MDLLRRDTRFMTKKLDYVYVCSEQFTEDCFEVSYRFEVLGATTKRRRPKQNAFSTIFEHKVPLKPRISSKRRIAQKEREEVSVTFSLVQQHSLIKKKKKTYH